MALTAGLVCSAATIDLTGTGKEKLTVSIDVKGEPSFAQSLKRNLERSGCFKVQAGGLVKVTGAVGQGVRAEMPKNGQLRGLSVPSAAKDAKAARMEARKLADAMCEKFADQKGFASDPIAFVRRTGKGVSELCVGYPDGFDVRQLGKDNGSVVGPRWKDANTLFYTGIYGSGPQVFEFNTQTAAKKLKWTFKGLTTGAAVSPDGSRVAIILSMHGNPELYVMNVASGTWSRLTTTKNASEGQPSWSPDGRQIVYVSDEARRPQLYVIDVATKAKRRLTSTGSQNVDPDWGKDGRITYLTKRGGTTQIAVLDPQKGEASAMLVGEPGNWEHPSWSSNGRHVVASRDRALYIVDTKTKEDGGDAPRRLFDNDGIWITPCWRK